MTRCSCHPGSSFPRLSLVVCAFRLFYSFRILLESCLPFQLVTLLHGALICLFTRCLGSFYKPIILRIAYRLPYSLAIITLSILQLDELPGVKPRSEYRTASPGCDFTSNNEPRSISESFSLTSRTVRHQHEHQLSLFPRSSHTASAMS